jgi:hypothetical protein
MVRKRFVLKGMKEKAKWMGPKPDACSAQRTPSPVPRSAGGQKRGGRITLKKPNTSSKRSKMHQCAVCEKWFPRPSGLATHMNSHSGMKRKGDNMVNDCGLGLMKRNNSLSLPRRVVQQIFRGALQREATPPDARNQSSNRGDEQGPGVHCRIRNADGLRRSTSKPSTGDAQMGSSESDITDIDRMERQIERLGQRWGGQLPDIVRAVVSVDTLVVGLGLWVLEWGIV